MFNENFLSRETIIIYFSKQSSKDQYWGEFQAITAPTFLSNISETEESESFAWYAGNRERQITQEPFKSLFLRWRQFLPKSHIVSNFENVAQFNGTLCHFRNHNCHFYATKTGFEKVQNQIHSSPKWGVCVR